MATKKKDLTFPFVRLQVVTIKEIPFLMYTEKTSAYCEDMRSKIESLNQFSKYDAEIRERDEQFEERQLITCTW